jgi:hypothetical protein
MSKIIIEGKISNWVRISIYKHVQNLKIKESHIVQDRDKVTCRMALAPPLHIV